MLVNQAPGTFNSLIRPSFTLVRSRKLVHSCSSFLSLLFTLILSLFLRLFIFVTLLTLVHSHLPSSTLVHPRSCHAVQFMALCVHVVSIISWKLSELRVRGVRLLEDGDSGEEEFRRSCVFIGHEYTRPVTGVNLESLHPKHWVLDQKGRVSAVLVQFGELA